MKPSNHKVLVASMVLVPLAIYCAALGWKFIAGLAGFIILSHMIQRVVAGIFPEPKAKKS